MSVGELNWAYAANEEDNRTGFVDTDILSKTETVDLPIKPKRIYEPGESRRILKNVIVISVSFTLLFTAFQSMANLQSSLNPVGGLGNYSLSTLYGALVLSSIFLPTLLIQKFTVKWTLVCSMFGYIIYIGAQFYPQFYTLIPAAAILGFGAAPLWSAKCTYLTHIGHEYAGIFNDNAEVIIVRFFGMFFLAFQSSQIFGNLISSQILSSGNNNSEIHKNNSICGYTFCPADAQGGDAIGQIDKTKLYTLAGIYICCAISAATVVTIFVDPLLRYGEKERTGESSKLSGFQLLTATGRQMVKPYQILIIPLTIWSGMEQGFFGADFTQAYISCAWGIEKVGYVMICYGICDAAASISFGPVIRRLGRIPVFSFGALLNVSIIIVCFKWKPDPTTPIIFFVIAGFWGICDAIWQTQINALYGVIFAHNEEAAFSNYRLWESIGFIISYVSSNNTCVNVKLVSLLGVITLGMIGYLTVELLERRKSSRNKKLKKITSKMPK